MLSGANGVLSEARWLLDLGLFQTQTLQLEPLVTDRPWNIYRNVVDKGVNFAKRQMTWFRCEPMYHWLNASKPLDTILEFIYDAYEKETETLVVPDSIRMNKDMRNSREANALKAYRPRNRHFIGREDCSSVLEWIRSEGCKSEVSCVEGAAI
ncbi:tRNA dimethylallyltransferase 9 [Raphanus sativus]|nr:tRNA dimethylallyltransferase 9 [Raphanus sativus]